MSSHTVDRDDPSTCHPGREASFRDIMGASKNGNHSHDIPHTSSGFTMGRSISIPHFSWHVMALWFQLQPGPGHHVAAGSSSPVPGFRSWMGPGMAWDGLGAASGFRMSVLTAFSFGRACPYGSKIQLLSNAEQLKPQKTVGICCFFPAKFKIPT